MINNQLVTLKMWAPLVRFSIRKAQQSVKVATVHQHEIGIAIRNAQRIALKARAIRTPKNSSGLRAMESGSHENMVAGSARLTPSSNSIGVNETITAKSNNSHVET